MVRASQYSSKASVTKVQGLEASLSSQQAIPQCAGVCPKVAGWDTVVIRSLDLLEATPLIGLLLLAKPDVGITIGGAFLRKRGWNRRQSVCGPLLGGEEGKQFPLLFFPA